MEGLDIRILSITILLSLVFLSRALVDCMFAFNLINEQLNSFVMLLCIIIFSEVCTSMAIVKLMKKGRKSVDDTLEDGKDNHFVRVQHPESKHHSRKQGQRSGRISSDKDLRKTNTRSGTDPYSKDPLNESCTSYGSFNPNLDSGMPSAQEAVKSLLTPRLEATGESQQRSGQPERVPAK